MHRKLPLENRTIYEKIRELSNISKFRIIELTQSNECSITRLAKDANLAFNKCSNYCTHLEKQGFVIKIKKGKNVFIKSKIDLSKLFSK